jgi:hypothetical protein|tara:strand:+ start:928 stop:1089 length:162 start_codon:yes stop_codon:yes gene_type:complete
MTVEEADKINNLYKQIDTLTAANAALNHDLELQDKLISIEAKLDSALDKLDKK